MSERFVGKVAIVTGGASGIGRRTAERLAAEGARVVVADRNAEAAASAAPALGAERGIAVTVDVTDAGQCRAMVQAAVERWGGLDLLVNSAGIGALGAIASLEEAAWDAVLDTNLKGTFLACQAAFPALVDRGGGSIVNLASLAGLKAPPGFAAYAASKAGVIQLTRILAMEGVKQGIRANALCPIWIDTPMVRAHIDRSPDPVAARAQLESMVPMGRMGTPDDVAGVALFLLSDEASFITGVALPIDGGAMCQ